MATGAFHPGAKEDLRGVGGGLKGVFLIIVADETDDIDFAIGIGRARLLMAGQGWIKQLGHHQVIRLVLQKAVINKFGVIAMCRHAADRRGTGQRLFPKRRPMRRISFLVGKQFIHPFSPLVGSFIGDKSPAGFG